MMHRYGIAADFILDLQIKSVMSKRLRASAMRHRKLSFVLTDRHVGRRHTDDFQRGLRLAGFAAGAIMV